MKQDIYWIWLSRIKGIGSRKFLNLYEHFKSIEKVYNAKEIEFYGIPNIKRADINKILQNKNLKETMEYINKLKKQKIGFLTYKDDRYPMLLKEIYDPPIILYYKGNMEIDKIAISIVGSRNASYYGLKIARKLAYELASLGVTIISGMARGIDTYAHKGAMEANGKTIAVLGCGVDVIYPIENSDLMKEIETKGLILSEYPLSTLPKANNFPARNRIISGLSLGTIVIEAGEKSGSLITAEFALEQGRNVYAIPNNIDSPTSKGVNSLIKEGAKVVTSIEDIIEDFIPYLKSSKISLVNEKSKQSQELKYQGLSKEEKTIIEKIQLGYTHGDEIVRVCNYPVSVVNSCLTILELKGFIKKYKNEYYIK